MARARRVCPTPNCGNLIDAGTRRCPDCAPLHERARGSRQQRGYDKHHYALRKRWAREVAGGGVECSRCGQPIAPTEPWHLDHTDDRSGYLGPSHARCNTSAGGQAAHQ